MPRADPFSFRPSAHLADRLISVVAATDQAYSRSEIVNIALELFFAQLAVCPSMLPEYDPAKDVSVTHHE